MGKTNRQYSHLYTDNVPEVGQVVEVAFVTTGGVLLFCFETTVRARHICDGESVILLNINENDLPSSNLSRCLSYTYIHKEDKWMANNYALSDDHLVRVSW